MIEYHFIGFGYVALLGVIAIAITFGLFWLAGLLL